MPIVNDSSTLLNGITTSCYSAVTEIKFETLLYSSRLTPAMLEGKIYQILTFAETRQLTLSRPIFSAYRNQSVDLLCKSTDWFLYNGNIGP